MLPYHLRIVKKKQLSFKGSIYLFCFIVGGKITKATAQYIHETLEVEILVSLKGDYCAVDEVSACVSFAGEHAKLRMYNEHNIGIIEQYYSFRYGMMPCGSIWERGYRLQEVLISLRGRRIAEMLFIRNGKILRITETYLFCHTGDGIISCAQKRLGTCHSQGCQICFGSN